MNARQLAAWAPYAGIAFVVLAIIGILFLLDIPDADASDEDIADYLGDGGRHARNIIGFYLCTLASLAFLWFLAGLRSRLHEAEGMPGTLSALAFGAGLLFTGLFLVSAVSMVAVAGGIEFGDVPEDVNGDFVRMLPQFGFGLLLVGGGFSAIGLILATSVVVLDTGVLPSWVAWLGFLAALALVFAFIFIPIVALLVWVLAVSIALLMGREEPASAAA